MVVAQMPVFTGQRPAFPTGAEWVVFRDGRVAIVHPDPYRVEFVDVDGRSRIGPTIQFDPVEVTEGHREQWKEKENRPRLLTVGTPNGVIDTASFPAITPC